MLTEIPLDAVDIATPVDTHATLCRLAAERGLHIVCQKPLAPARDEARRLIDDLHGRAHLMVHENWRFRSHYRTIRQWLEEGRIGRTLRVRMAALSSGLLANAAGELPALVRQPSSPAWSASWSSSS
jgi:predicted dehydrogenase